MILFVFSSSLSWQILTNYSLFQVPTRYLDQIGYIMHVQNLTLLSENCECFALSGIYQLVAAQRERMQRNAQIRAKGDTLMVQWSDYQRYPYPTRRRGYPLIPKTKSHSLLRNQAILLNRSSDYLARSVNRRKNVALGSIFKKILNLLLVRSSGNQR